MQCKVEWGEELKKPQKTGLICWKNKRQRKEERERERERERVESEELGIWGEEERHFVKKFPAYTRSSFQ